MIKAVKLIKFDTKRAFLLNSGKKTTNKSILDLKQ